MYKAKGSIHINSIILFSPLSKMYQILLGAIHSMEGRMSSSARVDLTVSLYTKRRILQ